MLLQRGRCDSVCSPLSGPEQRLEHSATYANTDGIFGATMLDRSQRGTTPNSGNTNPPDWE